MALAPVRGRETLAAPGASRLDTPAPSSRQHSLPGPHPRPRRTRAPCGASPGPGRSYHGQRDDAHQLLLAHVDPGDAQVRRDVPGVLHLPRDELRGRRVAGLSDLHVDLHDLVGGGAGAGGDRRTALRVGVRAALDGFAGGRPSPLPRSFQRCLSPRASRLHREPRRALARDTVARAPQALLPRARRAVGRVFVGNCGTARSSLHILPPSPPGRPGFFPRPETHARLRLGFPKPGSPRGGGAAPEVSRGARQSCRDRGRGVTRRAGPATQAEGP